MDYWTVYMMAREETSLWCRCLQLLMFNDIYYLRFVCSMSYSRAIKKKKKIKSKQNKNKPKKKKQTKNKNKQTNKNLISILFTLLALLNLLKCVSPTCFYNKNKNYLHLSASFQNAMHPSHLLKEIEK